MTTRPKVQLKRIHPLAKIPERGTPMSAGFDLIACIDEPISIRAGEPAVLIPTGLRIFMNDPNLASMLLPRSGLGHKHGLILGNTLGLIDADFQNQWMISAWNRGQSDEVVIRPGDKICQAIFIQVLHPDFEVLDDDQEFSVDTERGMGGFGSTGGASCDTAPALSKAA